MTTLVVMCLDQTDTSFVESVCAREFTIDTTKMVKGVV